jgi:Zn-dependent protease
MPMITDDAIRELCLFFPVFLFSLCVHEWAHAWTATKLGDATPKYLGRLTLNPMAHADPMGTIVFPILVALFHVPLFGWAKPVPVNERNFKHPRRHMGFVAAAGPLSNMVLAVLSAAVAGLLAAWMARVEPTQLAYTFYQMLQRGIVINLFLAFFNLIPLGPLDGAKVIHLFVPVRQAHKVDRLQEYGGMILMMLLLLNWINPQANTLRFISRPVVWAAGWLQNMFQF